MLIACLSICPFGPDWNIWITTSCMSMKLCRHLYFPEDECIWLNIGQHNGKDIHARMTQAILSFFFSLLPPAGKFLLTQGNISTSTLAQTLCRQSPLPADELILVMRRWPFLLSRQQVKNSLFWIEIFEKCVLSLDHNIPHRMNLECILYYIYNTTTTASKQMGFPSVSHHCSLVAFSKLPRLNKMGWG